MTRGVDRGLLGYPGGGVWVHLEALIILALVQHRGILRGR